MGLFKKSNDGKKPTPKMAKELSKTNKSSERIIPASGWGKNKIGERSTRDNLPVSIVKESGKKSIVVSPSKSSRPSVNATPKAGQPTKTIKTYEAGKLVMKEKQGKDLLGRPVVKTKTYGAGDFKKGKEKSTLTKIGIQRRNTY